MRHDPSRLLVALWPLLGLSVVVLLLIVILLWIRSRWRDGSGPATDEFSLLFEYREMHRRGELSDEEYRSIKGRLTPRIGNSSDLTPPSKE